MKTLTVLFNWKRTACEILLKTIQPSHLFGIIFVKHLLWRFCFVLICADFSFHYACPVSPFCLRNCSSNTQRTAYKNNMVQWRTTTTANPFLLELKVYLRYDIVTCVFLIDILFTLFCLLFGSHSYIWMFAAKSQDNSFVIQSGKKCPLTKRIDTIFLPKIS